MVYIKYKLSSIYNIEVKRAIDCESMSSVSTVCYEKINDPNFFTLKYWWNEEVYAVSDQERIQ